MIAGKFAAGVFALNAGTDSQLTNKFGAKILSTSRFNTSHNDRISMDHSAPWPTGTLDKLWQAKWIYGTQRLVWAQDWRQWRNRSSCAKMLDLPKTFWSSPALFPQPL